MNEQKKTIFPKKPLDNYARYYLMGIKMASIMVLGILAGIKIDTFFQFKKFPLFTILLALFSVALALYLFIKDVLKKKE